MMKAMHYLKIVVLFFKRISHQNSIYYWKGYYVRALCDIGTSINLMHLSIMKKLGFGEPKPTKMTLTLVDRFVSFPYGDLEDVLVKVNDLLFHTDFVIIDMEEDEEIPLLLGIPFLAISIALIDVEMGELMSRFLDEQVVFNIFVAMKRRNENLHCYRVDVVDEIVKDTTIEESPTTHLERVIVNSIECCDEDN